VNDKIYIHEFIDIVGHHRADYMHHITANWSPIGQRERNQLCFGVFGTVGSTGAWPEVVNIWEEAGWEAIADSFAHELGHASLQDPALAEWWAEAATFRSGGRDRLLLPAPWTRTIDELTRDGVRGVCYAHELVALRIGAARDFLDATREVAVPLYGDSGLELVGAWRTAMVSDSECLLLWAVPDWPSWASFERTADSDAFDAWRGVVLPMVEAWHRTLIVEAPLSPLRLGRQPAEADRASYQLPTRRER
jgi:hypothetical protein